MDSIDTTFDVRMAERLKALRTERNWSLDDLAGRSGISRATLSRLEKADVSPTANVLGRLCAAFGISMSKLIHSVEDAFTPLLSPADQPVWSNTKAGFHRRTVSPSSGPLNGEVLSCEIDADRTIAYDVPPRHGLEHHLLLTDGALDVTVDGTTHTLRPGDCLRYRLFGPNRFETPGDTGAKYLLFIV